MTRKKKWRLTKEDERLVMSWRIVLLLRDIGAELSSSNVRRVASYGADLVTKTTTEFDVERAREYFYDSAKTMETFVFPLDPSGVN